MRHFLVGYKSLALFIGFGLQAMLLLSTTTFGTPFDSNGEVELNDINRDTIFVRNGQSEAVVVAWLDDAELREAAKTVAEAIGHETELVDDGSVLDERGELVDRLRDKQLVLVGNANNNDAIYRLYSLELALSDSNYPGPEGWVVRTVCGPFEVGRNVVIVGATDAAGLEKSVAAFGSDLSTNGDEVTLPWGTRFESGVDENGDPLYTRANYSQQDWNAYREKITHPDEPLNEFPMTMVYECLHAADRYYIAGGEDELRKFKMALDNLAAFGTELYQLRRVEFHLKNLVIAWQRVKADPYFSQEDRQAVAQFFYDLGCLFESRYWSSVSVRDRRWSEAHAAPSRVITNHRSNGALGYLRLGLYLKHYCDLSPEAEDNVQRWIDAADRVFTDKATSFKPGEDANHYQWWTLKHLVKYAMWRGDDGFFRNGNARLMVNLILASADNLGHRAGYGNTDQQLTGFSRHARYLLHVTAREYGDSRAKWIAEHLNMPDGWRTSPFMSAGETLVEAVEPVDQLGIARIPWSRAIYDDLAEHDAKYRRVPWERTFDKLAFRAGFEPEEPYLLLDGIAGMGHGHEDANSIIRVTAHNHIWLIDDGYARKTMYDHNGIFVARDGRITDEPYAAELHSLADLLTTGFTRTTLDAHGLEWDRHIFWLKAGQFIVIDAMTCRIAGDYQTNAVWRSPVAGQLEGNTYTVEQGDATMRIISDGMGEPKAGWEYGIKDVDAHVFRSVVARQLQTGDRFVYAHVLDWPTDDDGVQKLTRVDDSAWRTDGGGPSVVVAIGEQTHDALETDAEMLLARNDSLSLVNATQLALMGDAMLTADRPVTIELTVDGRGLLICDEPTAVTFHQLPELRIAGKSYPDAARKSVQVNAGRHALAFEPAKLGEQLAAFEVKAADWPAIEPEAEQRDDARPAHGQRLWSYDGVREVGHHNLVDIDATTTEPGRSGSVANLIDGQWNRSQQSTLWPEGESVTITFDLGERKSLNRIDLYTWEGIGNKAISDIRLAISDTGNDGDFQQVDAEFPIVGEVEHQHSRIRRAEGLDRHGRYVRLEFEPYSTDDAVYLAEVLLYPSIESGEPGRINDVAAFDLTGDGNDEVLIAGSDKHVHCLSPDGSVRWRFKTNGAVNTVWAGELDGERAILIGSDDNHLYRLSPDGEQLWKQRTYGFQPRRHQTGKVLKITVDRLEPDGPPVILVGADNWHVSAFTPAGEELWHCWFYAHNTTFITTGDITGDGAKEVFLGNSFTDTNWIPMDGGKSHFQRTHIGPTAAGLTLDLTGDGRDEMVSVGQKGIVAVTVDGLVKWRIDTGAPQTCVIAVDVNGNGRDELITGGKNGFLWALGADGEALWVRNVGNSINDLAVMERSATDGPVILAASDDGSVQQWSLSGELQRRFELGSQVSAVQVADPGQTGEPVILATTTESTLHAIRP